MNQVQVHIFYTQLSRQSKIRKHTRGDMTPERICKPKYKCGTACKRTHIFQAIVYRCFYIREAGIFRRDVNVCACDAARTQGSNCFSFIPVYLRCV